ncbi:YoaK family protein [Nocardioides sp. AN3]
MNLLTRLRAVETGRLHLILMLSLTLSTGAVDAVGYLALDRVFIGNMTGNVVILGMGIAGAGGLPVVGPLLALCGFLTGAALGGRSLGPTGGSWSGPVTVLLLAVGATTIVAGAVLVLAPGLPHGAMIAMSTGLAVALGAQAATARHLAVKDVTTVVVTSTLTGLAADSVFGNRSGPVVGRRILAVGLMMAGAVAGGLAVRHVPGGGLVGAGAICLAVAAIGEVHTRRTRRRIAPGSSAECVGPVTGTRTYV